jgi:hypothetical protein
MQLFRSGIHRAINDPMSLGHWNLHVGGTVKNEEMTLKLVQHILKRELGKTIE